MPLSPDTIQAAIDGKTKPVGSLGRVEDVAKHLAALQDTLSPRAQTCRLFLFAADHGLANAGVSAYPQDVTRQMVLNMLSGGACANAFAKSVDACVSIVDAGVAGGPITHTALIDRRMGPGTENSLVQPAMSAAQVDTALQHGMDFAREATEDVLALGEMGIGNTASASLVIHKITGLDLDSVTGRGTGHTDAGLQRKMDILRTAAARTPQQLDAKTSLAEYGGFEIVMMTGAMLGAAQARKPVLVDGFIASAAALAACHINSDARKAMIFSHISEEQGHGPLLEEMGAQPLLDLGMRLGEGTGALLAWPIVKAAAALLRDVASFEGAGVSHRNDAP
ncbi:MAG: nicotinate-nucleotide--dimethylbenzimidazole phosphoribosyltransferase [Pseudomonadota bacterium]